MKCQIRYHNGDIHGQVEMSGLEVCQKLSESGVAKVSFDFGETRIALYQEGHYQIFGGTINYPPIG